MIGDGFKMQIVKAFLAKGHPGYAFAALCVLVGGGLLHALLLMHG